MTRNPGIRGLQGEGRAAYSRHMVVLCASLLVVATIAAYWSLGANGFINFDDQTYLVQNTNIAHGLTVAGVKWAFTEFYSCNWHPLTWLSHMLDISLSGMQPRGHHLVSLGFHIANTLLLFGLLFKLTGRLWAGAFVAALFALHPLHVESVAWASERKDVLSTFFWLATTWAYVVYVRRPSLWRYLPVLALYACGLMSKPMLVTLPLTLLLLDYWPLERVSLVDRNQWGRSLFEKLPLFVMAVCSSVVTIVAQQAAMSTFERVGRLACLANAPIACWRYIFGMIWPAGLAPLYPFPLQSQYVPAVLAVTGLAAVTLGMLYWGRRLKYMIVGWLWYLVTLVPVIGIIQVGAQSHADRYTYVPMIGLFIIVGWGAADIVRKMPAILWPVVAFSIAAIMAAGLVTSEQVRYWKNSVSLFQHTVDVTVDNSMAEKNLANALLNDGRLEDAIAHYRKAVVMEPGMKEAQLGMAYGLVRLDKAGEALPYCRKALELDANWAEAYDVYGMILGDLGRFDESIEAFEKSLALRSDLTQTYYNMATVCVRKGDLLRAIETYRRLLAVKPESQTYSLLGGLLVHLGRLEEAEISLREAARLEPYRASAHYELGMLLAYRGRGAEAVAELERALALEPQNTAVRAALAQIKGQK